MRFDLVLTSLPESDDLIAEVHWEGQPWAEVAYDRAQKQYTVRFCSRPGEEISDALPVAEWQDALRRATNLLAGRGYPTPEH